MSSLTASFDADGVSDLQDSADAGDPSRSLASLERQKPGLEVLPLTARRSPMSTLAQDAATRGDAGPTADEFGERMLASTLGMADMIAAYLGDRLGWYTQPGR